MKNVSFPNKVSLLALSGIFTGKEEKKPTDDFDVIVVKGLDRLVLGLHDVSSVLHGGHGLVLQIEFLHPADQTLDRHVDVLVNWNQERG